MMKNAGAQISDDQLVTLAAYLAENFPEKSKPQGVIVPGPAHVSFKEWTTPTPGSRPHDPLATLDGTIWYTGQMANLLGHIDPTTGRIDEYLLNTPMSGPHGLVADQMGDIWFTANFAGYIGKLDPGSGRAVEYRLPDPNARDPHTPLFDQNGVLWFTVQSANMVGRLDPKTGQIRLATSPTPRSNPYGLVIDSKGVPFFCEFGANKLASLDPTVQWLPSGSTSAESRSGRIGPISLEAKQTGERSAGNPHAAFDEAGASLRRPDDDALRHLVLQAEYILERCPQSGRPRRDDCWPPR